MCHSSRFFKCPFNPSPSKNPACCGLSSGGLLKTTQLPLIPVKSFDTDKPALAPLWKYPQSIKNEGITSISNETFILSGIIRVLKFIFGMGNPSVTSGFRLELKTAPLPIGVVNVRKAILEHIAL